MNYHPKTAIKRQALADFIVEFTYIDTTEVAGTTKGAEAAKMVETGNSENSILGKEDTEQWTCSMDGASNENRSGADMMLISPEGHRIHCTLHFGFQT